MAGIALKKKLVLKGLRPFMNYKLLQNQPNTGLCYKDFVEKLYESGKHLSNHAVCDGSRHYYVCM